MRLFGVDAARDPKRQANPGSQAGELWFIRLGRSHLALAPLWPGETPGIDHYCLSVSGFAKDAAKAKLAGFDQPYPDWPSNNVWLQDPDGLLIQLAPSANEPRLESIVRNATAVPRSPNVPADPLFRATRISRLVLASTRASVAADYYRRLLGEGRTSGVSHIFGVGPSTVVLTPGGTPTFRIAVAPFDAVTARRTLSALDIMPDTTRTNDPAIVLRDPDGIVFEIAGQ
jgi:catechol 2,3-dioxygenase-like lactoylglutathione lyase family enzyme